MCELFGVSANVPAVCQLSLRSFQPHSNRNPHGWGFAFGRGEQWRIVKESRQMVESDKKHVSWKAPIIIGHIRYASEGGIAYNNTHPFSVRNWAFAHNGTVDAVRLRKVTSVGKFIPKGDTDSEIIFSGILNLIDSGNSTNAAITEILRDIEECGGTANFLLSDGKTLYAYRDKNSGTNLHFLKRQAPFGEIQIEVNDSCETINLLAEKNPGERAIILATKPLTNEPWEKFTGLKCFRNGEEVPLEEELN